VLFRSVFQHVTAAELGAAAIRGALANSGVEALRVEHVVMGMVLQGGAGQIPSRQAARLAGLSWEVPTDTVKKVSSTRIAYINMESVKEKYLYARENLEDVRKNEKGNNHKINNSFH